MNKEEREALEPIKIEGVERVDVLVRNVGGEGVLFTKDGKMIGHQIAQMGHYYYIGHGRDRVKLYRASFRVDRMKSDVPNG